MTLAAEVRRAIDRARSGNNVALEELLARIESSERLAARWAALRHDLGNYLSIAQANVEAMHDGVLEPTRDRLAAIAGALRKAAEMLDDRRSDM